MIMIATYSKTTLHLQFLQCLTHQLVLMMTVGISICRFIFADPLAIKLQAASEFPVGTCLMQPGDRHNCCWNIFFSQKGSRMTGVHVIQTPEQRVLLWEAAHAEHFSPHGAFLAPRSEL
jgi:hypothetical protein